MPTEFTAPGPGHWALDRSHYPNGATPISQWLLAQGFRDGFTKVFSELGMPAERMDAAFVNGFMYTRLRPLVGADKPLKRQPPGFVLKIASRLHPEFRARNKRAIRSLRERPSNDVVRRWEDELRPKLVAANTAFQAFDPSGADDAALQAHVDALVEQLRENFALHFWLHGHDLGPIARYLYDCVEWGLDPKHAIDALGGASPSTARPIAALIEIRNVLKAARVEPRRLDDVRNASDKARQLLDDYLAQRGHVLATGYDLDSKTLIEMPQVILDTIRTASIPPSHNHDGIAGELRSQLPAHSRPLFDRNLADARKVMDMRDDNGPLTVEWPVGLLRRALLEAGRRLVERGAVAQPEHLFELQPHELRDIFGGALPPADELTRRADVRTASARLDAPANLGPPEPEPPADVLPPALAQLVAMVRTAIKYMGLDGAPVRGDGFSGVGIGTRSYMGTARVASSADEACERLEPGDVLVVRATSPAFNAILPLAGAIVTADGGVLSHAAVLSRELGIPAIIGAAAAMTIVDGSTVEVDPPSGRVRVIGRT